jgi:hypothetical protein
LASVIHLSHSPCGYGIQDGKALPDGPVVISPDGLFPSLYREGEHILTVFYFFFVLLIILDKKCVSDGENTTPSVLKLLSSA